MSKGNNLQSLFCGILFCISVAALVIACLAFTNKGGGKGEYYEETSNSCTGEDCGVCLSGGAGAGMGGCVCKDGVNFKEFLKNCRNGGQDGVDACHRMGCSTSVAGGQFYKGITCDKCTKPGSFSFECTCDGTPS